MPTLRFQEDQGWHGCRNGCPLVIFFGTAQHVPRAQSVLLYGGGRGPGTHAICGVKEAFKWVPQFSRQALELAPLMVPNFAFNLCGTNHQKPTSPRIFGGFANVAFEPLAKRFAAPPPPPRPLALGAGGLGHAPLAPHGPGRERLREPRRVGLPGTPGPGKWPRGPPHGWSAFWVRFGAQSACICEGVRPVRCVVFEACFLRQVVSRTPRKLKPIWGSLM